MLQYLKLLSVMCSAFIYCIFTTKWLFSALVYTKIIFCQYLLTLILSKTYMLLGQVSTI